MASIMSFAPFLLGRNGMVWNTLNHFGHESGIGLSGEQSEQEYRVRVYPLYALYAENI